MKLTNTVGRNERETSNDLILDLYEPNTASRHQVEDFIHHVFARAYQADLKHYMPDLMALNCRRDCATDNRTVAALGMRPAATGPLFLETYLDTPVEAAISQLHGTSVRRDRIMEVGNLASVHRGGLRQLIVALTSYLSGAGIDWVVFTAVPIVKNAFAALDLNLHPVAVADKSRLDPAEQSSWGRYYDTGPMVVAGRVEEGYRRLRELIELEKASNLSCLYLWQYAFLAGSRQRSIHAKPVVQSQEHIS